MNITTSQELATWIDANKATLSPEAEQAADFLRRHLEGIERLQKRGKPIPQSLKNILKQYTDEFVTALSSNGEG